MMKIAKSTHEPITASHNDLKARLATWLEMIWEDADDRAIARHSTIDAQFRVTSAPHSIDANGFMLMNRRFHRLFSSVHVDVVDGMQENDRVAATLKITATSRIRGITSAAEIMAMARFRGEKLCEFRVALDSMFFFEDLCLLPARAFDQCLLGVTPVEPRIAHVYRERGLSAAT